MSYTEFSTKDANYYLAYGAHSYPQKDEIFQKENLKSLDAIVIETGDGDVLKIGAWNWLRDNVQYKNLLENVENLYKETGKTTPIYCLDVGSQLGGSFIEMSKFFSYVYFANELIIAATGSAGIGCMGVIPLALTPFILPRDSKKIGILKKGIAKLYSAISYIPPSPQIGLRDAISARKIEKFVVPKLHKKLSKKPKIAIVYGAAHCGIETDLKHPLLRDSVIKLYKSIGYLGVKKDGLEKIVEGKYILRKEVENEASDGCTNTDALVNIDDAEFGWFLKEYETNLFK